MSDPFADLRAAFDATVRDFERRWGLTLVSFLPSDEAPKVKSLQATISRVLDGLPQSQQAEPTIEYYDTDHLHCTHMTLRRSSAWGPVREVDLVREDASFSDFFHLLRDTSLALEPITIVLDKLDVNASGLGLLLIGRTDDQTPAGARERLLSRLNADLPRILNLSIRPGDDNPANFHEVHCRLGFFKRPIQNHVSFVEQLREATFRPMRVQLESIALVHHRNRMLRPPHQGCVELPLGMPLSDEVSAAAFHQMLNLDP